MHILVLAYLCLDLAILQRLLLLYCYDVIEVLVVPFFLLYASLVPQTWQFEFDRPKEARHAAFLTLPRCCFSCDSIEPTGELRRCGATLQGLFGVGS